MNDYIVFMHDDAAAHDQAAWGPYLARLMEMGVFQGGSEIGGGQCLRKDGASVPIAAHLTGFIRLTGPSLEAIAACLAGNPHFEAGGTVEIRQLPAS